VRFVRFICAIINKMEKVYKIKKELEIALFVLLYKQVLGLIIYKVDHLQNKLPF
jgi:hypothetical protein